MYDPEISVVVPVFSSEAVLPLLYEQLKNVLDKLAPSWEIIMVDDKSPDQSLAVAQKLSASDPRLKVIALPKNQGQHFAIMVGLKLARGAVVITMDDDLQHPPEEIPKLLSFLKGKTQVVVGIFAQKQHSGVKRFGSKIANYLLSWCTGGLVPQGWSNFKAFARPAVDAVARSVTGRFYLAELIVRQVPPDAIALVEVEHVPSARGKSRYTLTKYVRLLCDLILSVVRAAGRRFIFRGHMKRG